MWTELNEAANFLKKELQGFQPEIGLVLGTGLGQLMKEMKDAQRIPYSAIPHFPTSTVQSHAGELHAGTIQGFKVLGMKGRFHYYEGYSLAQVVFPIRVMGMLGITHLVVTNAAGGVNPDMEVGEVMMITDHLNLLGDSPLSGPNIEQLGPRFPDMHDSYDATWAGYFRQAAQHLNTKMHEGVYAALKGPALETPAEYRWIRTIGADAVGMSTVPEVLAARHMGIGCSGFSAITDLGVPGRIRKVVLQDVLNAAETAGKTMSEIILGGLRLAQEAK